MHLQELRPLAASAALRLLDIATPDEFLRSVLTSNTIRTAVTPEGASLPHVNTLARALGTSPFSPSSALAAATREVVDRFAEMSRRHAEAYRVAARAISRGAGPETLESAFHFDLEDYDFRTSAEVRERDRSYYLAIALCDDAPEVAVELARLLENTPAIYEETYRAFLESTAREPADGLTIDDVKLAITSYLEGVQVMRRIGAEIDSERTTFTLIRIFWSHTRPIGGPDHPLEAEIFRAWWDREQAATR